ncbi:MAG: hypothetical protein ACHQ4J_12140 [Candidatus Binatia bacterium]
MKRDSASVLVPAIAAVMATVGSVSAKEIAEQHGYIYWRAAPGATLRAVATTGLDSQATLSRDGHGIAFLGGTPGRTISAGNGDF